MTLRVPDELRPDYSGPMTIDLAARRRSKAERGKKIPDEMSPDYNGPMTIDLASRRRLHFETGANSAKLLA